jgi:hypothetical protein
MNSQPPRRPAWAARRTWWQVLLVALVIRESFSFWTGHPYDTEVWIRTAFQVAHGTNPYLHFWPPVPGVSFAETGPTDLLPSAAYLPFWAIIAGGLYKLWVATGGGNPFVFYFYLKQPPILGDLGVGYLLYRLVLKWSNSDRATALAVLWFWALFPYDIVVSAIWGQFDTLVVCVVLGLLFVTTARERNVLNGLGIFMKWITVIFLPFEFFRSRGREKLWVLLALAIPFVLTLIAFVALGWGFSGIQNTSASESAGTGGGMNFIRIFTLQSVIDVINPKVPLFYWSLAYLWVPSVTVAGYWITRRLPLVTRQDELNAMMLIITVFLVTRYGLNEQYMLYLFPLMLLDIALFNSNRRAFFLTLFIFCFAFLIANNAFGLWFLSPVQPQDFVLATRYDASEGFGQFRTNLLDLLSILVTITLVQQIWLLMRRRADWTPWPVLFFHRFRRPRPAVLPPPT